ncbi:MAG TPA: hypothetical protein VJN71_06445 [Nitrososphaerales archaeon]|nr:hypothetical protein [Nitrososphaerales archaeon]
MSDEVEYFLGHSIDKQKYDKSPESDFGYWRQLYQNFSPYVNVISNSPEKLKIMEMLKETGDQRVQRNVILKKRVL